MHACLRSPNVGLWFKHQAYARVITIRASVDLGELLERQRRVDIELASVRAAVVKARRAARASSAPANRTWRLVGGLRNAIVLAYALAGYRVEAAAALLKRRAAKARWPPKAGVEIARMIEDCFLDFDVYELAALREGDATRDPAALREHPRRLLNARWRLGSQLRTALASQSLRPGWSVNLRRDIRRRKSSLLRGARWALAIFGCGCTGGASGTGAVLGSCARARCLRTQRW